MEFLGEREIEALEEMIMQKGITAQTPARVRKWSKHKRTACRSDNQRGSDGTETKGRRLEDDAQAV
jgi:hypothetical protein